MSYKYTNESFIKMLREVHSDRYDYSKVEYKSCKEKITIGCKVHGDFDLRANAHQQGKGCQECSKLEQKPLNSNTATFVSKAISVHGEKYNYTNVDYKTARLNVEIGCYKCGPFLQTPTNHLWGKGCPVCSSTGYNRGKSGYFYVLSSQDMLKVGITNKGVDSRKIAVSRSSGKQFDVVSSLFFENGQIPFDIEKQSLAWLRAKYSSVDERFDGYTECFTGCSVADLIDFIVPLAAQTEANNRSTKLI